MKRKWKDQYLQESHKAQRMNSTVEEPSFPILHMSNIFQSIPDYEIIIYILSFLKLEICFPNYIEPVSDFTTSTSQLISTCFGKFKNNANQIRIRQFFFHFKLLIFSPSQLHYLYCWMNICHTIDFSLFYPCYLKKGNQVEYGQFSATTIPYLEDYSFTEPFVDSTASEIRNYEFQINSLFQQEEEDWNLPLKQLHTVRALSIFIPSCVHGHSQTIQQWFQMIHQMNQLQRLDIWSEDLFSRHPLCTNYFPTSLQHLNLNGCTIVYLESFFSWLATTTSQTKKLNLQLCNISKEIYVYFDTILFQNNFLKELTISSDSDMILQLCCQFLKTNTSLTYFAFHQIKSKTLLKKQFHYKSLLELKYCSVTTLKLSGFVRVSALLWSQLLHRLTKNTTIQNLLLDNNNLMEEDMPSILELLTTKCTVYHHVSLLPKDQYTCCS